MKHLTRQWGMVNACLAGGSCGRSAPPMAAAQQYKGEILIP